MAMSSGRGGEKKSWLVDIEKEKSKVESMDPSVEVAVWSKQCIYQVPPCIRDLNSKAYKPQVVSFGPYHHGEPQVVPMELHKHRALLHFLARPVNKNKPFQEFVRAMEAVAGQLRDAYGQFQEEKEDQEGRARMDDDDDDGFLKMMIRDGCFMLEVLRVATRSRSNDYAVNDPIFSSHGLLYMVPYIKRDMLMIENQLPLLVLRTLMAVETGKHDNDEMINKLVLKFCAPTAGAPQPGTVPLGLHPLDVVRTSLLLVGPQPGVREPVQVQQGDSSEIIRSAMELNEAGIRFRRSESGSLRDIQFRHGVLILPQVVVDDTTEYLLLNLMALERLHVSAGNEVTAYVFFMDNIIDSARDVSLLHSKGIIQNALGSDKAVAKLFNSLSKDVVLDPNSSLGDVCSRVNKYCSKRWNMWRANLIHTYFRSPWAFLSLAAAIFLLALTVAQTVYAILPYYSSNTPPSTLPQPPTSSPH